MHHRNHHHHLHCRAHCYTSEHHNHDNGENWCNMDAVRYYKLLNSHLLSFTMVLGTILCSPWALLYLRLYMQMYHKYDMPIYIHIYMWSEIIKWQKYAGIQMSSSPFSSSSAHQIGLDRLSVDRISNHHKLIVKLERQRLVYNDYLGWFDKLKSEIGTRVNRTHVLMEQSQLGGLH